MDGREMLGKTWMEALIGTPFIGQKYGDRKM